MFFSDVEHEVLPVTQGHRITLTYNLYAKHYGGWKDVVDCLLGDEGNKEDIVAHLTKFSSTAMDFLSLKDDVQELICKQCGITGQREALIQVIHKTLKHVNRYTCISYIECTLYIGFVQVVYFGLKCMYLLLIRYPSMI